MPLSQLSQTAFPGSPPKHPVLLEIQTGAPTSCPDTHTLSRHSHLVQTPTPCLGSWHLYPALCEECFVSFPALLLSHLMVFPAGLPGQPLGVSVPMPSLERSILAVMGHSALPTLLWTGFGPSWGGHFLCLSPSAPGSHPTGSALLLLLLYRAYRTSCRDSCAC